MLISVYPTLSPATKLDFVWIMGERPLTREQRHALRGFDALLIMIPGVSSGDVTTNCQFLDGVRRQGGYPAAIFFDWGRMNWGRRVVARTATEPAAQCLLEFCTEFQNATNKSINILAHSAGTVVVNIAALQARRNGSAVRFRHVLFLGTALEARELLEDLKAVSTTVLNVHSAYDKVNRNINDQLGRLRALSGKPYGNLEWDRSLSGRLIRHDVFLASNPENWVQYGMFLRTGQWPQAEPAPLGTENDLEQLHRLALWVREHPEPLPVGLEQQIVTLLRALDPSEQYYGAVLAGLRRLASTRSVLKEIAAASGTPAFLRKEVYQAIANIEDPRDLSYLREARQRDRACGAELRDILRDWKRRRIEPADR